MAVNLNSSATQAAVNNVMNAEQNKNKTADGFEDGMIGDFDELMSEYNTTTFGTDNGAGTDVNFGDNNALGLGGTGLNTGQPLGFGTQGSAPLGFGQGMNGLGITGQLGQQQAPPAPPKPTVTDAIEDGTIAALKATAQLLKSFVKSLKGVTLDDFASLGMDGLITGGIISILGAVLLILGGVPRVFGKLLLPTGLIDIALGLIDIGLCGFGILSRNEPTGNLSSVPDTPVTLGTQTLSMDSIDDEYSALLDSFYDDDDINFDDDDGFGSSISSTFNSGSDSFDDDDFFSVKPTMPSEPESDFFDNSGALESIPSTVAKIDRTFLLDQFSKLLPTNCKDFGNLVEIDKNSDEFISVRSLLLQALSNVSKIPIEELPVDLEKLESTAFSYTMTVGRIKGITKLQDIANEIQVYFRENANDTSVIAAVEIEHGYYKISLTKGNSDMITIRDCLEQPDVRKYFEDKKNLLPFIAGIDTYGNPVLASGENYTAMLTAGKQRSGKSWYITSVLMTFMTFNQPTDVQFLFIDPKKSSLYRMFSCMPHTIGVHDDEDIIGLLRYLINIEGERRKERLRAANKGFGVDSIKDYRKEGHNDMPYLYIVIDEFLTAIANVEARGQKKEFNQLINMIITQLPFVGIHLWIVPHRAQGAVDKTARSNIMFTSAFRCENTIVEEVLDTKWTRPLKNPGDMAMKLQDIGKEMFARAAVFTTSDENNTSTIKDIAKAWYKIGADVPNVDYGLLANKDLNYVSAMLDLDNEQISTLKLTATAKQETASVLSGQSGMMNDNMFAQEHRQSHNAISDILNIDDDDLVYNTPSTSETKSASQLIDDEMMDAEDEDMLSRWREQLDDESNSESIDLTGWEDESSIFDD